MHTLTGLALLAALAGCAPHAAAQVKTPPKPTPDFVVVSHTYAYDSDLLSKAPRIKPPIQIARYPQSSIDRQEAGKSVVDLCVNMFGVAVGPTLQSSSGSKRLDDAAMKAAKAADYEPGEVDGSRVDVCGVKLAIVWSLAPAPKGQPQLGPPAPKE